MFDFSKVRKLDFYSALIISLGIVFISISRFQGMGFPKESELKYSTGVFNIVEQPEYVNHIMLNQMDENNDSQLFTCSYSPFGNGASSSCGDTKYLNRYIGNVVTIGWYEQKEFLGFKNSTPQLVNIEMDNEISYSYDDTAEFVNSMKDFFIYVLTPISILSFPFFYWLFGWLSKPRGNKKIKSHLE